MTCSSTWASRRIPALPGRRVGRHRHRDQAGTPNAVKTRVVRPSRSSCRDPARGGRLTLPGAGFRRTPRLRGEDCLSRIRMSLAYGPPPLARGELDSRAAHGRRAGITPASAGKTRSR